VLRLGTAGWAIPRQHAAAFPPEGSALERYAARFSAAEINSSFHGPHRPSTYARWAESVPDTFRFAAKLPKTVTHTRKLVDVAEPLDAFLAEVAALREKLAVLLVQLPPSLAFERNTASTFFGLLRDRAQAALAVAPRVACEPRHPTWFSDEADALLARHEVARVAADPARVPEAAEPGGWPGLVYHRLHGAPRMYYSAYEAPFLDALASRLTRPHPEAPPSGGLEGRRPETWCIFDNTASGAAAGNAVELATALG
jgi:uncharacterized protein YecE (DUF72 family)